jgi:cell wall hydrolase
MNAPSKHLPEGWKPVVRDPDVDLLARTLYGEARGEPVRGKEAVAAVVMNRVLRAAERGGAWWGNNVAEVVLRPWQFSCWNRKDPNRHKILAIDPDDPNFQCCIRIARRAVTGALQDPTDGATHYHTKRARPDWSVGRIPSAIIGNHEFYNAVE